MIDTIKSYLKVTEHVMLVVALIAVAILFHRYNSEKQARQNAEAAAKGLPAGTLAEYILKNRELLEEVKNAKGKTIVKTVYVPDEGGVQVVTKEKEALQAKYDALMTQLLAAKTPEEIAVIQKSLAGVANQINQDTTVTVNNWGLTSRFGYGLVASPNAKTTIPYNGGSLSLPVVPSLDWKFAYAGRYSSILQINPLFAGPGITRHVDDLLPQFFHAENLELGLTGGWGWNGTKYAGVDLRSNF